MNTVSTEFLGTMIDRIMGSVRFADGPVRMQLIGHDMGTAAIRDAKSE